MTLDTFIQNFEHLADAANGVQSIRGMILQLAVSGALVSQDDQDEPVSLVLQRVRSERGSIGDPLPSVVEEEIPHSIPKSWEWTRLGMVTNYGKGERAEWADVEEGTWTLELEDIEKTTSKLLSRVRCPDRPFKSTKNVFREGDVLYGKLRPYLDKVLVADEPGVCTTEIIPFKGYAGIDSCYLRLVLKTPGFISYATNSTHGMNLPQLGTEKARLAVIPLAPIPEQKRIVAKVNELMKRCDDLEAQQKERNERRTMLTASCLNALTSAPRNSGATAIRRVFDNFNSLIETPESVAELRKSILQLAVQGRLVPQDPNEEPASVLLGRIEAEKAHLIREGKIRKQESVSPPNPADVPYDLPKGWTWACLGNIGYTQTGTTPSKSRSEYFGPGYPFVKPGDISDAGVEFDKEELSEEGMAVARFIPAGSAMMVCIGGSIGKVGYVDRNCSCNQQINTITPYLQQDGRFIAYWMKSPFIQSQVFALAPQTTLPILSKSKWESLLYPLPPLSEQKRILTEIEHFMTLCADLEAKLSQARDDVDRLTASFVHHLSSLNAVAGKEWTL